MDSPAHDKWLRRFGVELEVNTLNGIVRRPDTSIGEIPVGADYVALVVGSSTGEPVELQGWDHVHNNPHWVVKPDNSCGIEINSPILKGWRGLKKLMVLVEALREAGIRSDNRCSLHVHVNIADLSTRQLAAVIAYYIKCEHIFFDAMPPHRKNNRYCQLLGMTELFEHDFNLSPEEIIARVSAVKYYSMNTYHFYKGGGFGTDNHRKKTIEFRIAEGTACLDPVMVKNWIRLLLHFVEITSQRTLPSRYRSGDPWTGLVWLDPRQVFQLLEFDNEDLSAGLKQVRSWFLSRLLKYSSNTGLPGIWSNEGRSFVHREYEELASRWLRQDEDGDLLYGKKYVL